MRALLALVGMCTACGPGVKAVVDQRCIDGTAVAPTVPPRPEHPARAMPQVVEPTLVEGHRIFGNKGIVPDVDTRRFMHQHHVSVVNTSFRICLGETGVPEQVDLLSPSCFPRYEDAMRTAMLAWRYSPYVVNGQVVTVCTAVTFHYSQR